MLKVGLTGGIGSGKSTVAGIFTLLGVPVFIADHRAQVLMQDSTMRDEIKSLIGSQAYDSHGAPDRSFIAARVFQDSALLEALNAIIHPAVRNDFETWCGQFSDKAYVIQEAAILFESGGAELMHENILVWAPEDLRLSRVMDRDNVSKAEVQARMGHQWSDDRKVALSQFIILNDDNHGLIRQVMDIDAALTSIASGVIG